MIVEQREWSATTGWSITKYADGKSPFAPQLVLYFGSRAGLEEAALHLPASYPTARLLGCSTAGEINGIRVLDDTVIATAIQFEHTRIAASYHAIDNSSQSACAGERLARDLDPEGLVHVFVLAEGLHVNGSELVKGIRNALPSNVAVTGGLAGDGPRFQHTTVRLDDRAENGGIAVVGFYGDRLRVGYGSVGGWDRFGPERLVTRSEGNVLYELDGGSALELYRMYLGSYAADLPASGRLFPLSIRSNNENARVVRTILGIDEAAGSLIFAGDIPEGSYTQLMRGNKDRLIDGAHDAADASYEALTPDSPDLAILISCVGRRLVLKQRVEEEVEAVRGVLGEQASMSGFYSYGEIAPFSSCLKSELHNQTMTITTFAER